MTAATALITGNEPLPALAEQAVREALRRSQSPHANSVLLFLSGEFTRHAQSAVMAAARAASCTQVFGGIAAGVCTEDGWALDRPAVAAMVLCDGLSLAATQAPADAATPLLCMTRSPFPSAWENSRRYGSHFHGNAGESAVWQMGRTLDEGCAEARMLGAELDIAVSTGLRDIGSAQAVDAVRGYDLCTLGGRPALAALLAQLPADWREREPLPLHLINACITEVDGTAPARIASLISANPDRSLTLTLPLQPGQRLCWAIREPHATEADMRAVLDRSDAGQSRPPDFALLFSCIGRGPYFYGGEDRDLAALVARFPGMPLAGTYGTGQIAFQGNHSHPMQNAAVTALFRETRHVQPQS